jgi:hypothetical protein
VPTERWWPDDESVMDAHDLPDAAQRGSVLWDRSLGASGPTVVRRTNQRSRASMAIGKGPIPVKWRPPKGGSALVAAVGWAEVGELV